MTAVTHRDATASSIATVRRPTSHSPVRRDPVAHSRGLFLHPRTSGRLSRNGFVVVILVMLAAVLVALLGLNMRLGQNSFAINAVQKRVNELAVQEQSLSNELATLESPADLEERAREMGMVPNQTPAVIDVRTGRIQGQPTPAREPVGPTSPEEAAVLARIEAKKRAKAAAAARAKAAKQGTAKKNAANGQGQKNPAGGTSGPGTDGGEQALGFRGAAR